MIRVRVVEPEQRGWLHASGDLLVLVAAGDDVWAVLYEATRWAIPD